MNLMNLGWNDFFNDHFTQYKNKDLVESRVINKLNNNLIVRTLDKEYTAIVSGKFRYNANVISDYPAVGDFVAIKIVDSNKAIIHACLPRKTAFVRKVPISGGRKIENGRIVGGLIEEQVIAANIDYAFIVIGLDENFNIQRIERYITLIYNSGAKPVIILNKLDVCSKIDEYILKVKKIAKDIDIYPVSVITKVNMEIFNNYLQVGKTIVLLGSSGVGKSSIINYLANIKQKVQEVSINTKKGKHTTTNAQLIFHNSGCMIIDTPGLKELQLWGDEEVLNNSFDDIIEIANGCKFRNCTHELEPGCKIIEAINNGTLSKERFNSYKKQLDELQYLSKKKKEFNKKRGI